MAVTTDPRIVPTHRNGSPGLHLIPPSPILSFFFIFFIYINPLRLLCDGEVELQKVLFSIRQGDTKADTLKLICS